MKQFVSVPLCSTRMVSETLKAIPDTDAPVKIKAALAKLLLARDGASVNPTCYYE